MKRINQFERTDRDITNALLTLMDKKSFEKITIQDILEESLINRSTFYQHFPDKYAILERLQERYIHGLIERIETFSLSGEYDLDKINAALLDYFSDKKEELKRLLSVRSETLDLEGRIREVFTDYVQRSGSNLSALETELLADFLLRYYVYKMQHGADFSEVSTEMLRTWLDMSVTFFRLDGVPDAKERLLDAVRELHGIA